MRKSRVTAGRGIIGTCGEARDTFSEFKFSCSFFLHVGYYFFLRYPTSRGEYSTRDGTVYTRCKILIIVNSLRVCPQV